MLSSKGLLSADNASVSRMVQTRGTAKDNRAERAHKLSQEQGGWSSLSQSRWIVMTIAVRLPLLLLLDTLRAMRRMRSSSCCPRSKPRSTHRYEDLEFTAFTVDQKVFQLCSSSIQAVYTQHWILHYSSQLQLDQGYQT